MGRKNKIPSQQGINTAVKNAVNAMIKYISVISIFIALGLMTLLYLGPELQLATGLVFRLAVPSVVLAISSIVIYELWIVNGRRSAFEEQDYIQLLQVYATKSEGLYYPTLQKFLDYEYERRYEVEHDRLSRQLDRERSILVKLEQNHKPAFKDRMDKRFTRRNIRRITRALDTIKVSMPYEKSEEFDYLRYNIQDIAYKEYSPTDTKKHLVKVRTKKYFWVINFTLVGLNLLAIGTTMGDLWTAIIMTSLAAVTLIMSVIGGFSAGYHNIKVISTGVYKTANSFLDQAVAYCKRENQDLYYKGVTEFRDVKLPEVIPAEDLVKSEKEDDIFTRAYSEVTETH